MGTDLYLSAERRDADGRWSLATPADGSAIHDGPSRALSAVLADVNNADHRDGEPFHPIALPRGVPADASTDFRRAVDSWGADGYAHSWLSVRELVEFDWQRSVLRRGVVFAPAFAHWD